MACLEQTTSDAPPSHIVVAIVTYRRPLGLERTLEALSQLRFVRHRPQIEVLVVDNDPEGSALEVCRRLRPAFRWPIRYEVESRRGIAAARNRAVACTRDTADFVAFVDDDGIPHPDWLDELLDVQRRFAADVVTGPQRRRFSDDAPGWIDRDRLLQPRRYPTGRRMPHAATGNVMVSTRLFRTMDPVFDERFGLAGGSDYQFFTRAQRAGYSIVWADDALVDEWTPARRVTLKWIALRSLSTGNAAGLLRREIDPPWRAMSANVAEALLGLMKGLLLSPLVVIGRRGAVRPLWHLARSAGLAVSLCGRRFAYYDNEIHLGS